MTIENVSDTARWVAIYRAMETERPDAIFTDPFARKLGGPKGESIVNNMPRGKAAAWAMITRTAVFDEIIMNKVKGGGVDLVLNLAAGLDARPWRMSLPAELRWVDVDLPGILNYKTETMKDVKPACRYEAMTVDLTDAGKRQALFHSLGAGAKRTLVVTEGLLIYLQPNDVGALATDLHAQKSFRWWLTDLASPRLIKMMARSWGKSMTAGNAPFVFAPAEGSAFFAKFGWREAEYRLSIDEARRLKREMPGMGFWRLVARLYPKRIREEMRRMSGILVLERE
jgi:methyltransferase (TIGR00027 family)